MDGGVPIGNLPRRRSKHAGLLPSFVLPSSWVVVVVAAIKSPLLAIDARGGGRLLFVGEVPPPPPIWDTLRSIDCGGRSSRAAERSAPIAIGFVLGGLVYASEEEVGGVITIVIGGRWGNCGRASPSEFLEAEDGASTTTAATARPMDRDVDRTTTMTTILRHLVVPGDDDGARRRRAGGSRSSSRRPAPRRMRRHGPPMAIIRSYLLPVLRLRYRSSLGLGRTNNLYFG